MSPDPVKGAGARTRPYNASRRQEQARRTRLEILQAARELFVRKGYGRTTITDIAASAGVSAETVYAGFGSKSVLLQRVWDITIGGDDDEVVYHERPEIRALHEEPDLTRRLQMQAQVFTQTARRIVPFLLAVQGAASAEPAAASMLIEMGRQRLDGMTVMATSAAATGQLAVSEQECRDLIWATTDGMLWQRLVAERGWPDEKFAQWLADLWTSLLVARPGGRAS